MAGRVPATGRGGPSPMDTTYSISHLAEEFAVTPRTLRFYEDMELLRPKRRGQTRVFSPGDRVRLKLILRGKRLGFSLADIKEMLDLYDLGDGQVEQLKLTLRRGHERIEALQRQKDDVASALGELHESCAHIERMLVEKGVPRDEV